MATLTRRRAGAVVGGMGAATVLAATGCGASGAPQPQQASTKPVTLTWAVRVSASATPEVRQKLRDEYKQVRPNVTVEEIDAGGGIAPSIEKIAAAMAAGIAVDVINGHLAARQLIESIDAVQPI